MSDRFSLTFPDASANMQSNAPYLVVDVVELFVGKPDLVLLEIECDV